jgi:hypothetical protein
MSENKDKKDKTPRHYTVGYGKPPVNSRFRKGVSGNPKGRPKGTLNLATVLERTLREEVVIVESGKRTIVTKLEAAMKQLTNKAAMGDLAAMRQLLALVISAEERSKDDDKPADDLSASDQQVMQAVLKRFEAATWKEGNNDTEQ